MSQAPPACCFGRIRGVFSRHKKGWVPSKQGYNEKHGAQEQNQERGDLGTFV